MIKSLTGGWNGDARLYRLSDPIRSEEGVDYTDVIVSAVVVGDDPETYIFGAAGDDVADWGELPGSFRGALDHDQALENAGYAVQS